ncbi:uncharacterized protein [Onthophagus taurus]|uniref:uncharacterized protein n=1 Tax=Onthophagus taurus TaxID=166361 RepID=UPI0039BECADA
MRVTEEQVRFFFMNCPDRKLRPIAYALRKFTDVEKRYATIDKEALAIIFAVTTFHQYIYGRKFSIFTDHRPLERIFGENRQTPKIASNRLLRWAIILNSYDYSIIYQKGKDNAPTDVLSRLPTNNDEPSEIENIGGPKRGRLLRLRLRHLAVKKRKLKDDTSKDATFEKISRFVYQHWPEKKEIPTDLHSFFEKREELSIEEGLLKKDR